MVRRVVRGDVGNGRRARERVGGQKCVSSSDGGAVEDRRDGRAGGEVGRAEHLDAVGRAGAQIEAKIAAVDGEAVHRQLADGIVRRGRARLDLAAALQRDVAGNAGGDAVAGPAQHAAAVDGDVRGRAGRASDNKRAGVVDVHVAGVGQRPASMSTPALTVVLPV